MAKPKMVTRPSDPLDALVEADPRRIIALMLWKERHRNPDMAVFLTEKDIKGLDDCTAYLEVKPDVAIHRPQGLPAQAAIPASGNRRAVPARAAEPPRPFVAVALIDKRTGDGIKPVENNEDDFKKGQTAESIRMYRSNAPRLAQALRQFASTGNYSSAELEEAAVALTELAKA